jgi:outer membrane protein assembly factor BamB
VGTVELRGPTPLVLLAVTATAALSAGVLVPAPPLLGSEVGLGAEPAGAAGAAGAQGGSGWTVYHGDAGGNGVAAGVGSVTTSSPAWTSRALDGQLYGQPVSLGDLVYVATENDTVDALSATTGAVVWSTHVGTPVPASDLPCGNITPTVGITGTPVVDPARSEVFAVADELVRGSPAHVLVGLNATTGRVELTQRVDPPGSNPGAVLQRTGLDLDQGRVVFGMGGNYGDCSSYRGRVLAVPETGGAPAMFTVDAAPDESEGAVWMGGAAPVVDPSGNVWVTTGNGSVTSARHPYDHSVAVLELSPSMTPLQYFAPTTWASDNANDLDLSTSPALLADGQVVAAGKARTVFLLDGSALGSVGGQRASLAGACGDDIDGGMAVQGTTVYLPCVSGPVAVSVSSAPPALHVVWRSSVGGGPPVLAGGLVWTMGQDGGLYGLDPSSGSERERVVTPKPANHFPTPGFGPGLLLAPGADRVVAFRTVSGPPASTTTSTGQVTTTTRTGAPTTAASAAGSTSRAGTKNPVILAVAIGAAVVAVGAAVAVEGRRRRRSRQSDADPPQT